MDPQPSIPNSIENAHEARLLTLQNEVNLLPEPLQRKWTEEIEKVNDEGIPKLVDRYHEFKRNRDRVLHSAPGFLDDLLHTERDASQIKELFSRVNEARNRPDLYVGGGKTASVYRDPNDLSLCYKIVDDFTEYRAWNSINKEAHFLEKLEDLQIAGVRTPKLRSVLDLADMKVIAMEYLDAVNVDLIIKKRIPLPREFNIADFFDRLHKYTEAMHAHDIYHRDLHGGNVLMGKQGEPYVVDFGQSNQAINEDDAYVEYNRTNDNKIHLTSDETNLRNLESRLRHYIASLKVADLP